MAVLVLYPENDNLLEWQEMKNNATGAYVNNATVSATLFDDTGAQVAGETWPKALAYVAGSNGLYRATLAAVLSVVAGRDYSARVVAVGGGVTGVYTPPVLAVKRV